MLGEIQNKFTYALVCICQGWNWPVVAWSAWYTCASASATFLVDRQYTEALPALTIMGLSVCWIIPTWQVAFRSQLYVSHNKFITSKCRSDAQKKSCWQMVARLRSTQTRLLSHWHTCNMLSSRFSVLPVLLCLVTNISALHVGFVQFGKPRVTSTNFATLWYSVAHATDTTGLHIFCHAPEVTV